MNVKKLLAPVLVLIVTSIIFYTFPKTTNSPTPPPSAVSAPKITITQKVNYGPAKATESAQLQITPGENALEILGQTKKIETKEFSIGKIVESIEGIKNGTDNKYWIYYVNGNEAKVGATEYKPAANDQIEWRFKTYAE